MTQPTVTPAAFAEKWRGVTTTEKASSQSHFIDLCRNLGNPRLLIVSDLDRIEIRTNFTSLSPVVKTLSRCDASSRSFRPSLTLPRPNEYSY